MKLLDRYLDSVAFWLPQRQKDDIIAELAEDLRTAIEERAQALGRQLTDDEVAELLKRRGHPMLVAGQYQPRGYLIGPALFPAYAAVLKMVALFGVVPWVLVWAAVLFYVPGAGRAHPTVAGKLLVLWEMLWGAAPIAFAAITAIFAVMELDQRRLAARVGPQKPVAGRGGDPAQPVAVRTRRQCCVLHLVGDGDVVARGHQSAHRAHHARAGVDILLLVLFRGRGAECRARRL